MFLNWVGFRNISIADCKKRRWSCVQYYFVYLSHNAKASDGLDGSLPTDCQEMISAYIVILVTALSLLQPTVGAQVGFGLRA